MSRDRSVYVCTCTCTRCGEENESEEREFRCSNVKCGVQIRLLWMAEYAPVKKGPVTELFTAQKL